MHARLLVRKHQESETDLDSEGRLELRWDHAEIRANVCFSKFRATIVGKILTKKSEEGKAG